MLRIQVFFVVVSFSGLLILHVSKKLATFGKCFGVLHSSTLEDARDTFRHNNPEDLNPQYQRCGNFKSLFDAAKLCSIQLRLTVHMCSDTGTSKELILGLRIRDDFTDTVFVLTVGARRNMTVS